MKRILSLGIICCMLLTFCGFAVTAAGMTVSVGTNDCLAGESVSIPITLSGNTGFSNLGIEIEYDDAVLTLTNVIAAQTGATYTAAENISANPYNMGWDSINNNTFNGILATLEFKVSVNASSGSYPVKVNYYKGRNGDYEDGSDVNYDESFSPLDLAYEEGAITINNKIPSSHSEITIKANSVEGAAGEVVTVPIDIEGNTGFANLGIEVEYNDNAMRLVDVHSDKTGATFTSAQNISANPFNMIWDSTKNNSFNGTLATLDFQLLENAVPDSYPITISYYKGRNGDYEDGSDINYDENFNSLNLSYVTGYVTVLEESPKDNKTIAISDVQNNSGLTFKTSLTSDEAITGMAVAAVYDNEGRLIAVRTYDASNEIDFSFYNIQNASVIKAFWWESMDNMTPQAHSKTIRL